MAQYYTSVRRADATTGAALRALDESGLRDRTLVIWLSDNGAALPFAKANVWLNSTRTPLIVRWPSVVKPATVDDRHLLGGVDLAPTILEAAGLPVLGGTEGRSFVPLLRGQRQSGREYVFTQIDQVNSGVSYPMRAVTGARYGYLQWLMTAGGMRISPWWTHVSGHAVRRVHNPTSRCGSGISSCARRSSTTSNQTLRPS